LGSIVRTKLKPREDPKMPTKSEEPEVLKLLKADHNQVKKMFREFEERVEADRAQAREISQQILTELSLHAEMEEQIIYPLLKGEDEKLFYQAQEEHHVAKTLISELQELEVAEPSFQAKMLVLRENVEHHIKEEESEMFDKLRELSSRRLTQAAKTWEAQKSSAGEGKKSR
jgi:hemerythrin superfamily protein